MRKMNKVINIALIFMLIGIMLLPDYAYSTNIAHLRVPIQPATYNRIEDTQKKIVRIQQLDQKAERDDKNKSYPQAIFKLLSDGKFRTRSEIAKILHSSERAIQPHLRFLTSSRALLKSIRSEKVIYYMDPNLANKPFLMKEIQNILRLDYISDLDKKSISWFSKDDIKFEIEWRVSFATEDVSGGYNAARSKNNITLKNFKSLLSAKEIEDLGKRIEENFKDNKQDALSIAYNLIYHIKKVERRGAVKGPKIKDIWLGRDYVYDKKTGLLDLLKDIVAEDVSGGYNAAQSKNNITLKNFKSLLSAKEIEDLGKRIEENFKDNKQDALSIAYNLIYHIKKVERREAVKGPKITYTWFNRESVYNKKIDLVMDIITEVIPYRKTHPSFKVFLKKDAKNANVHIVPYINIANKDLIRQHVIFLDKDIVNHPVSFKKTLLKIKRSYDPILSSTRFLDFVLLADTGRIYFNSYAQVNKPVILLTEYTEKDIKKILGEVISEGIYFRDLKKSKLGYAELEKIMMPIYDLPDMKCIVLTGVLDNIDKEIYTMSPFDEIYEYKSMCTAIVMESYAKLYYSAILAAISEKKYMNYPINDLTIYILYLVAKQSLISHHIKAALDEKNKVLWIFSEYYDIYIKFKINGDGYYEFSSKDDFKKTGLKEEDILNTWYKYSKLLVLDGYLQLVRKHFADPYGTNKEEMTEVLNKISKVALKHLFEIDLDDRLVSSKSPAELKKIFQTALPIESSSLDKVLARYEDQIMKNSVNLGDPRYVAHMTPYPLAISIFVELLISAVNPNQIAFEASPGGTFAELETIRWLSEIVGYDPVNAGGSIVAGGTTANETAFLVARNYRIHKLFEAKKDELYDLGYKELPDVTKIGLPKAIEILKQLYPKFSGNFVMLTSEAAHYSHKKLGGYIGIGSDNIIDLKTKNGKIDITLLKNAVKAHEEKGDIILAIISTAGTTEEGLYDDMQEIAKIAKEKNIWFHADSAYGGAVKMSQKYKDLAKGMELADSITIDPHKWFYIPYSIGAILFKDKTGLKYIKQSAAYALREDEEDKGVVNLGSETLQGSKRFDALKLWFALQLIGVKDFGKIIDYTIDQTREIAKWLSKASDFEVIREPQINVLCSRFIPKEVRLELSAAKEKGDLKKIESLNVYINYLNKKICDTLMAEGHWYFARTTLKNSQYRLEGEYPASNNLRVLMNINMNPYIDQKILQELYSHVAQIGYDLHKKYLTDASGLEYQILKEVRTNL